MVRDRAQELSNQQDCAFYRLPDARAGSFMPTLADCLLMRQGVLHLIEVKEVKHDFRLPHGNFGVDQVARMRTWKMAGAVSIVLIYHSTIGMWRGYDVDRFVTREGGSWDLRDQEPGTLESLLC